MFRVHAQNCGRGNLAGVVAMLIGVLISAVAGGALGMSWSLMRDQDLSAVVAAYPLGGILAVMAFVLLSLLRTDPPHAHLRRCD